MNTKEHYEDKAVALFWANLNTKARTMLAKALKVKAHPYAHFEFLNIEARKALTEHFNTIVK